MKAFSLIILVILGSALISCSDDDLPAVFSDEEFINKVELVFSPKVDGEAPITVNALDADGFGVGDLVNSDSIRLKPNTSYDLFVFFKNTIDDEDITEEVEEEGEEHMVFYAFSEGVFSSPVGDGNVDDRMDQVNYLDQDSNGEPVGLTTSWVTGSSGAGSFELVLKHQPDIKSATSTSEDGETDILVSWGIVISD